MKKILFNDVGEIAGRYIKGVHSTIPSAAIEIADELFKRTILETDGIWRRDPETGVIAKHPLPAPEIPRKTRFSVLEFRDRFTLPEQLAIRRAQLEDMEVGLVYDNFQAAQYIDIEDPRVADGLDLYEAKGLLEPGRKEELLMPEIIQP